MPNLMYEGKIDMFGSHSDKVDEKSTGNDKVDVKQASQNAKTQSQKEGKEDKVEDKTEKIQSDGGFRMSNDEEFMVSDAGLHIRNSMYAIISKTEGKHDGQID